MNKFIHQDGLLISKKDSFNKVQNAAHKNLIRTISALTRNYGVVADLLYNNSIVSNDLSVAVDTEKEGGVEYGINDGHIIDKFYNVISVSVGNTTSFIVSSNGLSGKYIHVKPAYYYSSNGSIFMPGYPKSNLERKLFLNPSYQIVLKDSADGDGTCIAKVIVRMSGATYMNSAIVDMRTPYNMGAYQYRHRRNQDTGTSQSDFYAYNNSASGRTPFINRDNMLPTGISTGICKIVNPKYCTSLTTAIANIVTNDYIYLGGSGNNYNVIRVSSVDATTVNLATNSLGNESDVYYSVIPKRYSHVLYKLFNLGIIGTSIVELYDMHFTPAQILSCGYNLYVVEDIDENYVVKTINEIEDISTSIATMQVDNKSIIDLNILNAHLVNYYGTPKVFTPMVNSLFAEGILTSTEHVAMSAAEVATRTRGSADTFYALATSSMEALGMDRVYTEQTPGSDITALFHSAYVATSGIVIDELVKDYEDKGGIISTAQETYLLNSCTGKGAKLAGIYDIVKELISDSLGNAQIAKKMLLYVGSKELSDSISGAHLNVLNYANMFNMYDDGTFSTDQFHTIISERGLDVVNTLTAAGGTFVAQNNNVIDNLDNVKRRKSSEIITYSPNKVAVHMGRLVLTWDEPANKEKIKQYKIKIMKISPFVDISDDSTIMSSNPTPEDMRKRKSGNVVMEYPTIYADKKSRKLRSVDVIYDSANDSTLPATKYEMYVYYNDKFLVWIAPVTQYNEGEWSSPINIDVNEIRFVNGDGVTLRSMHDKLEMISRKRFSLLEDRIMDALDKAIKSLQVDISDKITATELEEIVNELT